MANDFGNPAAQASYQAFGVITQTGYASADSGAPSAKRSKTVKRICEGVLLSPQVVLTGSECLPSDATPTMHFEFLGDSIEIKHANFKKARRHYLIQLYRKPKKEPSVYPFLSWFTGSESVKSKYGLREETIKGREVYLSTWLAHKSARYDTKMPSINTALQDCKFDEKDKLIALKCKQLDVCKGKTVLSGSAFFTFTKTAGKKIVSIAGLVSLRSSGAFCKATNKPGDPPYRAATPKKPDCSKAYVCGARFIEEDVREILKEARLLDPAGMKFHDDYLPSGTRSTFFVSSYNVAFYDLF